jgi:methanethiol S-methyltransferase
MYVRLAHSEERAALRQFGPAYERYAAVTRRWLPRLRRAADAAGGA